MAHIRGSVLSNFRLAGNHRRLPYSDQLFRPSVRPLTLSRALSQEGFKQLIQNLKTCLFSKFKCINCFLSVRPSVRPSVRLWTLTCGRRFLRNCRVEFNDTWYNTCMIGGVDARSFIFGIGSFSATWSRVKGQKLTFSSISP